MIYSEFFTVIGAELLLIWEGTVDNPGYLTTTTISEGIEYV